MIDHVGEILRQQEYQLRSLERAIMETPTSLRREKLTEANIHLMECNSILQAVQAMDNDTEAQPNLNFREG
jgi:ABC-type uncharacterized transport system YnjBCD substrate-binding protein